jgi:glycosyltransferase involved in cell wall biosynthesis
VLFVSERADLYGGGQHSLLDLATVLAEAGARPAVVLSGGGPLADALERAGVAVRHLSLPPIRPAPGMVAMRAVRALASLARAEASALLHSDAPRTALYAGLAARLAGTAHVWHVRASVGGGGRGGRRPGGGAAPGPPRGGARPPPPPLLVRLAHRVIAVSRAAARRSAALRRARHVRVVPTGIRPPELLDRRTARTLLDLPQEGLVVGVVGRVEPDKGGEDALAVLAGVRDAVPGTVLVFLGNADPEAPWPMTLRLRAAALGLLDGIRFAGERPGAARLLAAFDLILHPSRHEALPRVLIEAAQAAVPVVAYAVGGVGEVVEDGVTGLLAPPRELATLGAAAVRLAADGELRHVLGDAARRRAAERFDPESMGASVLEVYREAIVTAGVAPGTDARRAA